MAVSFFAENADVEACTGHFTAQNRATNRAEQTIVDIKCDSYGGKAKTTRLEAMRTVYSLRLSALSGG